MEIVRKVKKSKKRRHRSSDNKKDDSLESIKNLYDENFEKIKSSKVHQSNVSKDEVSQTENPNSPEEKILLLEKEEQIKILSDKLQQVTSRLYESKNAYTSLKHDFNKAQKLLCSEVGENVTVAGLSSQQPGGWRGRADQIHQLQQKLSELQLKLTDSDAGRRKSLDRRSSSSARIFDRERKQQLDQLSKELKDTEAVVEATKKKLEAAKARIAVLENDQNKSRRTISLLNEKNTHDNQLIEALHEQIKTSEMKFEDRELEVKKQNDKYEREIVLLKSELEAMQLHMKNFKRQIDEREKEIETLKSRNGISASRIVPPSTIARSMGDHCMDSPRSSVRDGSEYAAIGVAAEAERDRLLELITVYNRRLDKERCDFEQLSESFKKERSRAARLETKLQKMELERMGQSRVNSGSYRSKTLKFAANDNGNDYEEMRLRLELLEEESLTLKTRLATIQKEKAADLVTFRKMLDQTRKIFREAYKGKVSSMGSHSSVTV